MIQLRMQDDKKIWQNDLMLMQDNKKDPTLSWQNDPILMQDDKNIWLRVRW